MDSAREQRVIELLEDCVRTEIRITSVGTGLELDDLVVENLVQGVTSGILFGFSVDWNPDWVGPGDLHRWREESDYFARCPVCLIDCPAQADEAAADEWVHAHRVEHDVGVQR